MIRASSRPRAPVARPVPPSRHQIIPQAIECHPRGFRVVYRRDYTPGYVPRTPHPDALREAYVSGEVAAGLLCVGRVVKVIVRGNEIVEVTP